LENRNPFWAGTEAFFCSIGGSLYNVGNRIEQGFFDNENFDQQIYSQTERIINVSNNIESVNGTLVNGYVVPQALVGDLTGTNPFAEALGGYDLGQNELLNGSDRVERGIQGVSQISGTLAGGLGAAGSISRIITPKPTPRPTPTPSSTPKPGSNNATPTPCLGHSKISSNLQNKLIETGTPLKNGNGWVKRWTRMTVEDELRMARDISEYSVQTNIEADLLGLSGDARRLYNFIKMQEFRTNWRADFLRNRSY
jgi:hypothetical protein